ncbi:MAG: hypothetical protein NTY19_45315 [Planctomycetota bacterium]|nr:hypothetical protein [Planctomycetota bacterium]
MVQHQRPEPSGPAGADWTPEEIPAEYRDSPRRGGHNWKDSVWKLLDGASFQRFRWPLTVGGVIAGGLVLLCLVWKLLTATVLDGGLPNWVRYYVPSDSQTVVYCNLEKFHSTKIGQELKDGLASVPAADMETFVRWEEVRDVFVLVGQRDDNILVLRTKADLPVADLLVSKVRRNSEADKFKGFEYVRINRTDKCLAKTGDRIYCTTDTERNMEKTLNRLKSRQLEQLNKVLQRAIGAVYSTDYYVAGRVSALKGIIEKARGGMDWSNSAAERAQRNFVPARNSGPSSEQTDRFVKAQNRITKAANRMLGRFEKADYYTVSLSMNSRVSLEGRVVFPDRDDAEEFAKAIEDFKKSFAEELENLAPAFEEREADSFREGSMFAKKVSDGTRFVRHGSEIRVETHVETNTIIDMINRMKADGEKRGARE